jgi:hypothetical protein
MNHHIGDTNKMINDGGPAFPNVPSDPQYSKWDMGMTLRDFFAAAALQGLLAQYDPEDELEHYIAKWSYEAADAMLKAREAK